MGKKKTDKGKKDYRNEDIAPDMEYFERRMKQASLSYGVFETIRE